MAGVEEGDRVIVLDMDDLIPGCNAGNADMLDCSRFTGAALDRPVDGPFPGSVAGEPAGAAEVGND